MYIFPLMPINFCIFTSFRGVVSLFQTLPLKLKKKEMPLKFWLKTCIHYFAVDCYVRKWVISITRNFSGISDWQEREKECVGVLRWGTLHMLPLSTVEFILISGVYYNSAQYSILLYSVLYYGIAQCSAALPCIVECTAGQFCLVLYNLVMYNSLMYNSAIE